MTNGGAIYTNGAIDLIEDSSFDNLRVTGNGGAIYIGSVGSDTSVINSPFTNGATNNGGAIYTNGAIDLIECPYLGENIATNIGGTFYIGNSNSVTTIKDTTFSGADSNKPNKGGAIYTEGKIDLINNSYFEYNYGLNGGAIYIANPDSLTSIQETDFYANGFNSENGGAIYTEGSIDKIENCDFDTNNALVGGAIYTKNIALIENSKFDGNGREMDNSKGGAIYLKDGEYLSINNSQITNNHANEGGAIYTTGAIDVNNSDLHSIVHDTKNYKNS